jgi:LPXTG-motif cell wall-anchored protein
VNKSIFAAIVLAALSPVFVGVGVAHAAPTYSPELVYSFDSASDSNYAPHYVSTFGSKLAIQLQNNDVFISDGTTAGTVDFTSVLTSAGLTNWSIERNRWTSSSVDIGGVLYFLASDDNYDTNEVYKTDGVTVEAVTTNMGRGSTLYFLNGELYVATTVQLAHVNISTGAVRVIQVASGDCGINDSTTNVQYVNGLIVFVYDNDTCDSVLYSWDPANPANAPVPVAAASGGFGSDPTDNSYLENTNNNWIVWNGELYLGARANNGTNDVGDELVVTDGTSAGTRLLKDVNDVGSNSSYAGSSDYMRFTPYNGELYFYAFDDYTHAMWRTDGTEAGTIYAVGQPANPGDYSSGQAVELNGKLFLDFYSEDSGNEFYMTDGTDEGTVLLADINAGSDPSACYSYCQQPVALEGLVFFIAYDGTSNQIWETDGTTAGTRQVTFFGSTAAVGAETYQSLVVLGDSLYFGVNDGMILDGSGQSALYRIGPEAALPNTGVDATSLLFIGLGAVGFIAAGIVTVTARRRSRA